MAKLHSISLESAPRKRVIILGVTGTIGKNTLDIIAKNPDQFELLGVSAHSNIDALVGIIQQFAPRYVALSDRAAQTALKDKLAGHAITVIDGEDALTTLASMPSDIVVHGIVGAAGMRPLYAALKEGRSVALANKESLVCAGHIMMQLVKQHGSTLYPVDSEHNAIFQLCAHARKDEISAITLTASGGPFRTRALGSFDSITPKEAVNHPNWSMGAKISVDSATMANKGLELIEAHYLFDTKPDDLHACIHPESVVHGLVHLRDGSVLAHLSVPDMRIPIAYALHAGARPSAPAQTLDITTLSSLNFEPIDAARYPVFGLCTQAMRDGPAAMVALNAANEVAVQAFLEERIGFTGITKVIHAVLEKAHATSLPTMDDVLAYDHEARTLAHTEVSSL